MAIWLLKHKITKMKTGHIKIKQQLININKNIKTLNCRCKLKYITIKNNSKILINL